MNVLAVDTGYSFIKYAYLDSGGNVKFNRFITAVAPVDLNNSGVGSKSSVRFNGKDYLVGSEALYADSVLPTRSDDFLTAYAPLFLHKIIAKHDLSPQLVSLSLSISEFKEKNKQLQRVCEQFVVNDKLYSFKVAVFPQGFGIWKYVDDIQNAVILDIGFNTIDVLSVLDGKPSAELSTGYKNMGVCEIASSISEYISANITKDYVPEPAAIKILTAGGKFKINRKEYDISDFIESKKAAYTKKIFDTIAQSSTLKRILDEIDTFIVAGGGAYFIDDELKEKYGFIIPDKPEYANVLGFIKIANSSD